MAAQLMAVNRTGNDTSLAALPKWAQELFKSLWHKGFLFEVWSPTTGNWEVMKQPNPCTFTPKRVYRLYSRDGVHAHLGFSNVHPVRNVLVSDVQLLDNKIAVGCDGKDAAYVTLQVK